MSTITRKETKETTTKQGITLSGKRFEMYIRVVNDEIIYVSLHAAKFRDGERRFYEKFHTEAAMYELRNICDAVLIELDGLDASFKE